MSYFVDISKAKTFLNWVPKIDIDEGLKKTTEWYSRGKR